MHAACKDATARVMGSPVSGLSDRGESFMKGYSAAFMDLMNYMAECSKSAERVLHARRQEAENDEVEPSQFSRRF
jgi:hypothetical protein